MEFREKETRFAERRLLILQWAVVSLFILLLSGFWRLQILYPEYYTRLAERNRIKELPIPAPRGRILDRHGRVLVDNYPAFRVFVQWSEEKKLQDHLPAIAAGLHLDPSELAQQVAVSVRRNPYRAIVLRDSASWQEIAFVETHRSEFPELDLMTVQRRLYPPGGFAAHLLGYVGEVSESDIQLPEFALLQPGDLVGKSGVERQYNSVLQGEDGVRRVVVNSYGTEVAVLEETHPRPGTDLRLTLDADLQEMAERNFQEEMGSLVALDPRTGEVLTMVSRPSFDPNLFTGGISGPDWSRLLNDPRKPLLNRAIQAQLAPGSVFKIMMAAAALETGTADETTTFYCPGGANFYGRHFQCWQKKGHGRIDLHRAMVQSCDVFFYNLGRNLGIDAIADYAVRFGLGRKTGIDLPNEQSGTVPSPEWKERVFQEPWYAGETISVAIGQGALTVTPLQLAYSVGGIASDGYFARPHLSSPGGTGLSGESSFDPPGVRRVALQEGTVMAVTDALYGVVNEGGTGGRARVPGLDIGGKTGTAQVVSIQAARNAPQTQHFKDNAWFVGLAPRHDPEIVVAVLFQEGEHGSLAAPLARDVIRVYFDKKNGVQPQLAQKDGSRQQAEVERPPGRSGG